MTIATNEAASLDMDAPDTQGVAVLRYLGLNPNNPADRAVVMVCRNYDLDPVLKHVIVIPKGGVYITRDGLLHIAHRSGQLDGIVVDQEPTLDQQSGEWVARVSVYRKDMRHPFTFPGRYPVSGSNRQYAPEMALKAAEAHALRRAFAVTGLPAIDEQRPEQARQVTAEHVPAADRMRAVLAQDEPEPDAVPLDTGSKLAKRMFALLGNAGITEKPGRLAYVGDVIGREVGSSTEMTEDEARAVILALEADAAGMPDGAA